MKKIILSFILAILIIPTSSVFAEISNVKVKGGKTMYAGSEYTLVWKGTAESGVSEFSVWLVGGTLSNAESKFLGTVSPGDEEFKFIVPHDIKPGKKFSIQLSGKGASGDQVDGLIIKKAKDDKLGKKRVMLQNGSGSVLIEGEDNIISWKGGNKKVQVGVLNEQGNVIGWIKLNAKPDSKITWDTKKVCDLAMTVCWDTKGLIGQYGKFKLIVVSEDEWGNMTTHGGNYDESDQFMAISSQSNVPADEVKKQSVYTLEEIMKKIEEKYKKSSKQYKAIKALFE